MACRERTCQVMLVKALPIGQSNSFVAPQGGQNLIYQAGLLGASCDDSRKAKQQSIDFTIMV